MDKIYSNYVVNQHLVDACGHRLVLKNGKWIIKLADGTEREATQTEMDLWEAFCNESRAHFWTAVHSGN